MRRPLQGIACILFGILLILVRMIDPWIPIVEDAGVTIIFICGIIFGIIGVVLSFKKDEKEK